MAAVAGAHSFQRNSESPYPIMIGDDFQIDFRQHQTLGTIAAFSRYGERNQSQVPSEVQLRHNMLAIRHARGDVDVGPLSPISSFVNTTDHTGRPDNQIPSSINAINQSEPTRVLQALTRHDCRQWRHHYLCINKDVSMSQKMSNMVITVLHNAQATRDAVKAALRRSVIAHFACHGEAHAEDPLRSTLFLHDWRENRLSVEHLISVAFNSDISKIELEPKCKLAFLSACESAAVSTTDPRLRDETIHLAVAFQIGIGIPHVAATWWKLLDAEAVRPACRFYAGLKVRDANEDRSDSSDGGTLRTKIDVARTPYAVDGVVRKLRQRGLSPFVWGAYVHFGP
jgi:CHAT domain